VLAEAGFANYHLALDASARYIAICLTD